MTMIYKKDIAHCMGHGCPFTHKCYRNYLHHEFKRSKSVDVAPYINEMYIKLFDNCSSIILLQNEKLQEV